MGKSLLISFLFFLMMTSSLYATHNRAGEITYKQISALQYEFTLTTFTEVKQGNADRPTATLNFGDGTSEEKPRSNKTIIAPFIQRNTYKFLHTFPGYSNYVISYQDPNRNANVQNMSSSVNTAFYIETELTINPFIGFNTSPILLLEPIDFGVVHRLFVHNPNAYDPDGDSLSFKLVPCKQDVGEEVFKFQFPNLTNGFTTNKFEIDAATGQLVWENPGKLGLYNIAIMIEEWRYIESTKKYMRIGSVVRDMQIEITNSQNRPPIIRPLADTCILAGSTLTKNIFASDSDNHAVTLTATGGPFQLASPDIVIFPQPSTSNGSIMQTFNWITSCLSVRKQPYQIVFKATDNGSPKLVDLESWQIRVISPPPQNLNAEALGSGINLSWDKLNCGKASGYQIYRKRGSNPFVPGTCETGISADKGYQLIKTIDDINVVNFRDDDNGNGLATGNNYCYRILAFFPDGALSVISSENCARLTRDVAAITNVSINTTDASNGSDSVIFAKPTQLDTLQYPGPYEFRLLRSSNLNPTFQVVKTGSSNFMGDYSDTVFRDINLNTLNEQFIYKVDLFANNQFVNSSKNASSILLGSTSAQNRTIELNFNVNVPWSNDSFIVYRKNILSGVFDSVGVSYVNSFTDTGLVDAVEYCYYVKSVGKYSGGSFKEPLVNLSQEYCITPYDTEKPCPPDLTVIENCNLFRNELSWIYPVNCERDVVRYKIYKSMFAGSEFDVLAEVSPEDIVQYSDINLQASIAGCYFITAIDSFGNESDRSNMVCVDNCPKMALPNVFTPNEDGFNDYFTPRKDSVQFLSKVNATIYNRYGRIVFQTEDPLILWNGKDQNSGEALPAGTYFYTVEFSEIRLHGLKPRSISGVVELIR